MFFEFGFTVTIRSCPLWRTFGVTNPFPDTDQLHRRTDTLCEYLTFYISRVGDSGEHNVLVYVNAGIFLL